MSSASHSSTVVLAFGEGHRPLFSLPTRCSVRAIDIRRRYQLSEGWLLRFPKPQR
jgi:hypothetical protein